MPRSSAGWPACRARSSAACVVGVVEAEIRHLTVSSTLTGLPELCIFGAVLATLLLRPQGLVGPR